MIFLLGWPLEWPAIIFIFLPIFLPVVEAMEIDLLWFSTLVAVNLQTAFLSPAGGDGGLLSEGRGARNGSSAGSIGAWWTSWSCS